MVISVAAIYRLAFPKELASTAGRVRQPRLVFGAPTPNSGTRSGFPSQLFGRLGQVLFATY